jgi:uncharacterized protein UPF0547
MNRTGNPLGLGLVIVGAVAMALSAFLPLDQPTGPFGRVQDNTLIQHGGWLLVAVAVAIAASGYSVNQGKTPWPLPTVLCAVAGLGIIYVATSKDMHTLYPVGANGTIDTSLPGTVASPGIAVYVAGAGVALALIGSLMLRDADGSSAVEFDDDGWPRSKKCPDCAETVLSDAKVCKHCGYRFGDTTSVACFKCGHRQRVPMSAETFTCEECNTRLKRKASTDAE